MGWQDRDYATPQRRSMSAKPRMPRTLTGWVMAFVVVGFVASLASEKVVEYGGLHHGALAQGWRLVSYPWVYLSGGTALNLVIDLLFHLALLWTFGRLAETLLTRTRWLSVVAAGVVLGALGTYLAWLLAPGFFAVPWVVGSLVISSALAGACVARVPHQGFGLFFLPIVIELRWIVLFFAGLLLLMVCVGRHTPYGELAQLISMASGYAIAKFPGAWRNPFTPLLEAWHNRSAPKSLAEHHAEVDRILVKIKREGMGALTGAEKRTLKRDTARLRK